MADQDSPIQFRDEFVREELEKHTHPEESINVAAKNTLRRYFLGLIEYRPKVFTREEAQMIMRLHNGTFFDHPFQAAQMIHANVEDAIDMYFEDSVVDRDVLVAKIKDLTFPQSLALIDAIERFWTQPHDENVEDLGLVKASTRHR